MIYVDNTAQTTGTYIWTVWNAAYTSTAAITTTSQAIYSNTIWNVWNQTYTGTGTLTTQGQVINGWPEWNKHYETAQRHVQQYGRRKPSDEEVRAALEREKRLREEAEARAQKALRAKTRAEQLLRACLSPAQIEDLDKKNCFYVEIENENGKKERYRIDRGSHGNVKQLDALGSVLRSFCIQPPGVPEGDAMLAQKLFLESSEETRAKFWETANITELKAERAVPHHIPRHQRRKYAMEHGLLH